MRTLACVLVALLAAGCAQRAWMDAPAGTEGTYRLVLAEGLFFADTPVGGPECTGLPAPRMDEDARTLEILGRPPPFGSPAALLLFVTHDVVSCPVPLMDHGSSSSWGGAWGGVGPGQAFELELLRDGGIRVDRDVVPAGGARDFVKHGLTLDGRDFEARMTVRDMGEWPLAGLRFLDEV